VIVRNAWYVAAWSEDLTDAPLARRICGQSIVLFRTSEGEVSALRDSCVHRGASLSLGTVVPKGIRCNYHGLVFDGQGTCVEIPGQELIARRACVPRYPVHEKNRIVWIWMGDPASADPSEILDYPIHDQPDRWPTTYGVLPCKANYLLLIDNLLDATHLAYVHPSSVGGAAPTVHFEAQSTLDRTPNGLYLGRLMPGSPAPPVYNNCVPFAGPVDRWQEFTFTAPAVVVQYSGAVEHKASRDDWGCTRFDMRIFHAITPINDTESYYFYTVSNGHNVDDPTANEMIASEIARTLIEDKTIVEAQQERLTEFGEDWLVSNRSDAARLEMRRAVRRMKKRDVLPGPGMASADASPKTLEVSS
jgi:phenylpropionate dioxygenase-like ring-hydroxylating dioxygenase large terminal subunit